MASAIQSEKVLVAYFKTGKSHDWYSMLRGPPYKDFTVSEFEKKLLAGGFSLIRAIKDAKGVEYECSHEGLRRVEQ